MDDLSPAQHNIVNFPHDRGHLLVVAAPGSGKTRTITERVGSLLTRRLVEPEQILVMTFTTRVATELMERLHNRLDTYMQSVWTGTFHSVCDRLLRDHGHAIGWESPYTIYDVHQQAAMLRRAAEQVGYDLDAPRDYKELASRISSRKRLGLDVGQQRSRPPFDSPALLAVDEIYRRLLAERHALDYDDLILKAVHLLQTDDETATLIRNRCRYLFIDEFHDVSPEQYELIRLIAPPRSPQQHVMTVADANQAIFGWRDADAQSLLAGYTRDYRPRRFVLEENYRSAGNLVRAAQYVITAAGGTAHAVAVQADHYPIDCQGCTNDETEGEWLAQQIQRACGTGRYSYGDIAVLYRIHARANRAEEALLRHAIPLTRIQPGRFFDQPDVQAALRYLALMAALHDDDFEPALNWPRVLVDELTMIHLRRIAGEAGVSISTLAKHIDDYADRLTPLTRATMHAFLDTVAAELLPVAHAPINVVVEKLLTVLAARRSPIPVSRRADALGLLDVLARPLVEPVSRLHTAITAGQSIVLRHDGTVDGAAAATIVEHVLTHYLHHQVSVEQDSSELVPGTFLIAVGTLLPPEQDGLALQLRDALTIRFSLSAQAWRLGQMLLMRYETLRRGPFVLYDLETSDHHVNTAEILEVAALSIADGRPCDDPFHNMVRPRGTISPDATQIHGIRAQDVRNAPVPAAVLPQLLSFMGAATLVGHNIEQFDQPILRRVARSLGLPLPANPLLDTCTLARRLLPNESHALEDLAQRFGIKEAQTHHALDDVRMNAEVFEHLLDLLANEKELDVLDEALPLVALGIQAAGLPLEGENELLALAGARAHTTGLGDGLGARLATRVNQPLQLDAADLWLVTLPTAVAADDLRWAELNERWRTMIAHYCRTTADQSLTAFLHYAALAAPIDYQPEDDGRVAMMTIHTAKGREWPLVFLIGAEDDVLPMWNCRKTEELAEERRVLYVAMTRAKRRLCISWAKTLQDRTKQPSRFLKGMPEELMVWRCQRDSVLPAPSAVCDAIC